MIRIDDTLLEEIGLIALPKQERDQLLKQIYETLEMRVGMRLAERMTDQQLDEFERFIDTNDEAGALKWLETNFPDYKQVVADELDKLKAEIKQDSGKIIEAMQAQGGSTPAAPVTPGGQPQTGDVSQTQDAVPPAPQSQFGQQPTVAPESPQSQSPANPDFNQPQAPTNPSQPFGQDQQPPMAA